MSVLQDNPFIKESPFPLFNMFHVKHIGPAVDFLIAENMKQIRALVTDEAEPTWENFVEKLEVIDNRFEKIWGPIGHIDYVKNTDEWHERYTVCLEQITAYQTEVGQNKGLYKKFKQLSESKGFADFNLAQKKVIEDALRNFKMSGIALPEDKQKRYKELSQSLSQSSSQFGNNVLKATQAWFKQVTNEDDLQGLPDASKALLKQLAEQRSLEGWCITLDFPSYLAVMTYADNREIRRELYRAFVTKASDQADDNELDNSRLIDLIRKERHELARLLGFDNYAEYSIETKMASGTDSVLDFLRDLAQQSKSQAENELVELKDFAKKSLGIDDLASWDFSYVSEKLKSHRLNLSKEKLRPYFPIETVINGMFSITETLFKVRIEEFSHQDVWHESVRTFRLIDERGLEMGSFYLDLYARENKRGGAWMDSAVTRWKHSEGKTQNPVAYLVCNFTPPVGDDEACLSHEEVTTLFHEFGHGIHHLFTKMEQLNVSGIAGVPWDAVELPSQFMENFCWEKEGINFISSHVKTGESLPDSQLEALKKGRGFQSAMMLLRQIEFALADFEMHCSYDPDQPEDITLLANRIRKEVAVVVPPEYSRTMHSFSHIFAGGYAAGYYSYKWAEVLSADAFSLFEEQGILNPETGIKFKNTILAAGGSVDPMTLFKAFRGRAPEIDALLRHSGIGKANSAA